MWTPPAVVLLALVAAGCTPARPALPLAPVDVVESPELASRLSGRVLVTEPLGVLRVVELPGRRERRVAPPAGERRSVWSMSEDATGRVALAVDFTGWRQHALRVLERDGREVELARAPGGILWHNAIGPVAMAPSGGAIAFVAKDATRLGGYDALGVGTLSLWDPDSARVRRLPARALAARPSWFPDATRIAYVAPPGAGDAAVGPTAVLLDLRGGARRTLGPGHFVLVSTDGESVLVARGAAGAARWAEVTLVRLGDGVERAVRLPGATDAPVALIAGRYVVYRGVPSRGQPTGVTRNNSPLVGPKSMHAVKVVDVESGATATLVSLVDPRSAVAAALRAQP